MDKSEPKIYYYYFVHIHRNKTQKMTAPIETRLIRGALKGVFYSLNQSIT